MLSRPDAICILAGSAGKQLAEEVISYLRAIEIPMNILRYSDGEIDVEIEETVRGKDVFVIQPTCPPVNENLMELLVILDAVERSSGGKINAVLPYFGYSRKERKTKPRDPITGRLVADMLKIAGADSCVLMELHAPAIEGFFSIPTNHLETVKLLANAYIEYKAKGGLEPYVTNIPFVEINPAYRKQFTSNLVVASPDVGGARRARNFSRYLGQTDFAIIEKRRTGPDQAEVLSIVGDVAGKEVLIVDDLVSTGGSLAPLAKLLKERGALKVYVAVTHALLVANAVQNLSEAGFDAFFCTNTVPVPESKRWSGLHVISVGQYLAAVIQTIHENKSLNRLISQVF